MNRIGLRRAAAAALMGIVATAGLAVANGGAASGTEASLVGRVGMASPTFWFGATEAEAHLSRLADNGVTWVREDFRWDVIQPARGTFSWTRTDTLMAAAAKSGVQVLGILDYSATWASSDPSGAGSIYYPPTSNADYATFAAAVVERYGPGGTFWASRPDLPARPLAAVELWNEPWGHWFWKGGISPTRYAAMSRAAATAIRAAAPTVKILLSGDLLQVRTDGALVPWLDNVLAADPGLVDLVDAYSIHPYPYPRQQGPMVDHADRRWDYSRVALIRDVTVARNAVKPLWITEVGWSTASTSDSVTEATQATFVRDAIDRAFTEWPYVERFFLYTSTKDRPDMTDREAHYGVQRADGTWKPSWTTLTNLIAASGAPAPTTSSTTSTTAPTTSTTSTTSTTTVTVVPDPTIVLTATTKKLSGKSVVTLVWTGASTSSVKVVRNDAELTTTVNDGSHVDALGRGAKGTYRYSLCDATKACSATVSVKL